MEEIKVGSIMLSPEEKRQRCVINTIKMLIERKWLNKSNWINDDSDDSYTKKMNQLISSNSPDHEYIIHLDKETNVDKYLTDIDKTKIYIKFIYVKYTSTSNSNASSVNEFIKAHKNHYKILIFKEIKEKMLGIRGMSNTEYFKEETLLMNIFGHKLCPKYEVLTPAEVEEVLRSYNMKKRDMHRIFDWEPVVHALKLKLGDVVRIIRNTDQSLYSVDYRIVIT